MGQDEKSPMAAARAREKTSLPEGVIMSKTVGFIGYPNVGKTYLFNRIEACNGCVGNWSGVTATCRKAKK